MANLDKIQSSAYSAILSLGVLTACAPASNQDTSAPSQNETQSFNKFLNYFYFPSCSNDEDNLREERDETCLPQEAVDLGLHFNFAEKILSLRGEEFMNFSEIIKGETGKFYFSWNDASDADYNELGSDVELIIQAEKGHLFVIGFRLDADGNIVEAVSCGRRKGVVERCRTQIEKEFRRFDKRGERR